MQAVLLLSLKTTATQLASELPQNISNRLKLPWPLSSDSTFEQSEYTSQEKSAGLESVQRRGEPSEMERFAGRIKSSIQPYESNVNAFQPVGRH